MIIERIKHALGMSRIMFLDIDGVVCTMRSHLAFGDKRGLMEAWDITVCQMIRQLCEDFGFKIVISSCWRSQNRVEKLRSHLCVYGLIEHLYEGKGERKKWFYGQEKQSWEWRTKYLYDKNKNHMKRGYEIKEWLKRHPFVSDYIIVDDDSDMLDKQMNHFYKTDSQEGFGAKHYMDIFNRYSNEYKKKVGVNKIIDDILYKIKIAIWNFKNKSK